ncbi:Dyp-type peroxidase [Demequina sp. SYSU T00039]|uniref:Dyp-type peroxidase n=1 Tax=Demequina lignilytica TaxID=3051663 RepID=A0AAW7M3F8_9MICO|nr:MULTISPECIES: Dyp-type peroxidase [unclassified Demequina]MDN4477721.1 Dyp-type peroxidase [Demequina sp. SYSU T00039-1]MDN4487630.1 Dyp-type peroxidase [Demequina sp. SYSU T00039]MDN4491341.1 Dyp-type peroxidase [Demequina sp. SYSU T00068]
MPDDRIRRGPSRRQLLLGGAAAGAGAAVALGADRALASPGPTADTAGVNGDRVTPFHGPHQAGVTSSPGAHATYLAFDLLPATDRAGLERWLRLLSDDAARITQGRGALADLEPELAVRPAGLTATFGVGPAAVALAGAEAPAWLGPLPGYAIDRLEDRWSGGDLLVLLHGDDPTSISHLARMLVRDSRAYGELRWRQSGFRRAYGSDPQGTTMRNLFGQVDGSRNPGPGDPEFDAAVWARDDAPAWLAGGTSLVLRRIAMDLEGWDAVDVAGRENAVGRRLSDGAPLTGGGEHDDIDPEATGPNGFTVINPAAHAARARETDPARRIVRLSYSYDDDVEPGALDSLGRPAVSNVGLLFGSWQADVAAQYVPVQDRLAEADLMNTWTTPIGSAVFAVLPGCEQGGFVGETLF